MHTLCLIARLCRAFFMHEGSAAEYTTAEMFRDRIEGTVIARLCRAFFMHKKEKSQGKICMRLVSVIARYVGLFSCTSYSLKEYLV